MTITEPLQLNRLFRSLRPGEDDRSEDLALRVALGQAEYGERWSGILQHRVAVICGGAGSGKTTELRQQLARMKAEGTPAFFVRLEDLSKNTLEASISNDDTNRVEDFRKWRRTGGQATFFLDALDEARLPRGHNGLILDRALSACLEGVEAHGKFVTIVLSTRGSEWQDPSDRPKIEAFTRRLMDLKPSQVLPDKSLDIFALRPLTYAQTSQLAVARGIDGSAFCAAISNAKVDSLAQTPLEARMLLDIWEDNIRAGRDGTAGFTSRANVFRRAVDHKLRPPLESERRSDLSYSAVYSGIKAIAAACTVTGLRDLSLFEQSEQVIDLRPFLSAIDDDWGEPAIRQLLSSSFFDPDSGGRVRFGHREIQDYLAAVFFDEAIRRLGGSCLPIDGLLARFGQETYIPSSLYNFFGWLATFNPAIRRLVTQLHPSLLMETGDPTLYSLQERAEILISHSRQYERRSHRGEWFRDTDLSVFATDDLSEIVSGLIDQTPSDEFRRNLIDLARLGEMEGLANQLCDIACNRFLTLPLRTSANEALTVIGGAAHQARVRHRALLTIANVGDAEHIAPEAAPDWNAYILSSASVAAPLATSIDNVTPFISVLSRERRNHSTVTGQRAIALMDRFGGSVDEWLGFLIRHVAGERDAEYSRLPRAIASKRALLKAVGHCVLQRLDDKDVTASSALLDAIELCFGVDHNDGDFAFSGVLERISTALQPHTDLKIELINRRFGFMPDRGDVAGAYRIIGPLEFRERSGSTPIWTLADVTALVNQARASITDARRRELIGAAGEVFHRLRELEDRKAALKTIRKFVHRSRDVTIRRRFLERQPAAFYRLHFWLVHRGGLRKIRRSLNRALTGPADKLRSRHNLWRYRAKIRSGEARGFLAQNAGQQPRDVANKTLWTHLDWVNDTYGRRAGKDIRQGYISLWRSFPVTPLNTDDNWAIAEAASLGIELDIESETLGLQAADAERAFTIAFSVLNDAPDWIAKFLPAHDDLLQAMLRTALPGALAKLPHPQGLPAHPIGRLRHAPMAVRRASAPVLAQVVVSDPMCSTEDLEAMLTVILHAGRASLVDLDWAAQQFRRSAASGELHRAWVWMIFLFRADAAAAWSVTQPWMHDVWPDGESSPFIGFMARYGDWMDRSSDGESQDSLSESPMILLKVALLALRIANPKNDPRHEDVYSPGVRDKAAEQRRYWFERLAETGDPEVWQALKAGTEAHLYKDFRETLLYHTDRLSRGAARQTLLRNPDLPAYMSAFAVQPTNRADFSRYVITLTQTLLKRFATSDHDEARPYRRRKGEPALRDENDFRNWLCARLAESADAVFTVTRESEAAEENRTDILVTARQQDLGCVVIEVKLADRKHWSGALLIATLETQVSRKYLNEDDKHTGLLVLINTTGPSFRKTIEGVPKTFDDLLDACRNAGKALSDDKIYHVIGQSLHQAG